MSETQTLPGSRWRTNGGARRDSKSPTGAGNRVREAQRQARVSLLVAAAFFVSAAVSQALALATGASGDVARWLPLHLFLAGGVASAISGATVLFVVTWSAAPAPSARVLAVQRTLVAGGAAGVVIARVFDAPPVVLAVAGSAFAAGLAVLAVVLLVTVRTGVERRFDVAVAWYEVALVAALTAAALGVTFGSGAGGMGARTAHVLLNLLGFVGLVVLGTLPTFAGTAARMRMSGAATPARHRNLLVWQTSALVVAAAGAATGAGGVTASALAAYAVGLMLATMLLPVPDRKKLEWAGPRVIGLWAGVAWWLVAVAVAALQAARGEVPFSGRSVVVLAVAGYGQIVWASLAYLAPVLRAGGHERLSAGFRTTRSWTGLAAVNVAGVALLFGSGAVAGVALAGWAVDAAVRGAALFTREKEPA